MPILIFYFISKLFNIKPGYLKDYGGEYFPFLFIGLIIQGYLSTALRGFSAEIRSEQLLGTLERIISTTITPTSLILRLIAWPFLINGINILIYFVIGVFLFNLHLFFAFLLYLFLCDIFNLHLFLFLFFFHNIFIILLFNY